MTTPRRRFLGSLAALPLAPIALEQPPATPSPTPPPSPPAPVAEAMAEVARRRFGTHLDSGDAEAVTKLLAENLRAAERLQAKNMGNADEPVTVFAARPRPSGKSGGRR